jgi:small subunit ribosomal protein S3e
VNKQTNKQSKQTTTMALRGGATRRLSTKKKFVADGVFYAELNELFTRELAEDGYAGVEVRTTPHRTELIIRATRTQNVLGENNRRIRELTSIVQKRFDFQEGAVELYAERVQNRGLCAQAQAESLKFKLLGGLAVRRACYGVVRFVMEASAKGCEVIVTGKLRGQRAKAMKFGDGYMIKTGHAGQVYTDSAVRHVLMRQGVIGIKVSIMLPHDPKGQMGPKIPLDDVVTIMEPKEEISPATLLAAQAAQQQQQAFMGGAPPGAPAFDPMAAPVDPAAVPAGAPMDDPNVAAGF